MKTITFIITLFLLVVNSNTDQAQNAVFDNVKKAFTTGDSKLLSNNCNTSVEVVILGKEGSYTPAEAEIIFKHFFDQNKPKAFTLLHNGGNENSKYGIGNYKTETNMFRVYFLMKATGNNIHIHQLRIEKE